MYLTGFQVLINRRNKFMREMPYHERIENIDYNYTIYLLDKMVCGK